MRKGLLNNRQSLKSRHHTRAEKHRYQTGLRRRCGLSGNAGGVRRWLGLPAAFCLICCMLLCGCTPGASVDSMLKPPSLSAEQQQIYLALQDAVGSGITLQYPRAGNYLSAFTIVDLDADGEDEALVFYKKTSLAAAENSLRLGVLDQVDGAWMSVCDRPADGTEIERVVISPMGNVAQNRIFIGYSGVNQSDKALAVYNYSDGVLDRLFLSAYTMFDVADLDGDFLQELLVLSKTTDSAAAEASMYRMVNATVSDAGRLSLRSGFTDYAQVTYGTLSDGGVGIYIDGNSSAGQLQTEVLSVQEGELTYALSDGDAVAVTTRTVGCLSMDIDGDGEVEIPVQEPFPGYGSDSSEQVRLTRWLSVSAGALVEKERGYYSLNDSCMFLLPQQWYGTVTAITEPLTGDIVFCRYDGEISDDMTELLRYAVVQDETEQAEREADGYQLLRTRGNAAYLMRVAASDDPLAMSWEELLAKFLFFS